MITIYPSSWYYNACVQGFLEVLAWGLGERGAEIIEKELLQADGRVVIPDHLARAVFSPKGVPMPAGYTENPVPDELGEMKRITWWWVARGYEAGFMKKDDREKSLTNAEIIETVCRSLFHKSAPYPNLAQLAWDKIEFLNKWFTLDEGDSSSAVICSFCGQSYAPEAEARVYDAFLTRSLSIGLGSSPGAFPNLFWDVNPNLAVCKHCRSYFLCFHLVQRNGFFINSDSLQVNWHLNRLLAGKLRGNRFGYQTALLNALQYDPQIRRGISSWGLQDLDIIVFERDKIHYFPLPPSLAKMLLVPRVSSLLSRVSNKRVWELVLKEQFDYLPTIIYKSLRAYLIGDNLAKDPEVVYESVSIQPLVVVLTLYLELNRLKKKERGEKGMSYLDINQLRNLGNGAPLNQDDNLVFRLLELTRLYRKADVYHLLLRIYVAAGKEFPEQLARVFTVRDPNLFKTGIYAYISGLKPKKEEDKSSAK